MRQMTTDGKEIIIPDHCVYCNLDTGGAHEAECPLYMDQEIIDGLERSLELWALCMKGKNGI